MKKILLFTILVLGFFLSNAQSFPPKNNTYGVWANRFLTDSTLYLPTGCGVPTDSTFLHDNSHTRKAAKYYDSCGHNEYVWDPALKYWKLGSSNSIDSITKLNDSTALFKRPNGNPDTLVVEGVAASLTQLDSTHALFNRGNNISDTIVVEGGIGGYVTTLLSKADSSAAILDKGGAAPADTLYVLGNTAKLSRLNDSTALLNHGDLTNDTLMIEGNGTGGYVSSLTQLDSTRALLNHGDNTKDTLQIISSALDTISYPTGLSTIGKLYKVADSIAATISLSGTYTNGVGINISGGSINTDTSGVLAAKSWVNNLFQLKGNWALKTDTSLLNLQSRFNLYQPVGNYLLKTDTSLLNIQSRLNLYQVAGNYALKTDTSLLNLAARFGLYQPVGSYLTSGSLSGYAMQSWVTALGYITGITSSNVTTALGYTPYSSSNPSGYLSSYTETDPIFSSSVAHGITSTNISNWNSKQNAITTGTTSQYLKGDLSLGNFPTNVSSFSNDAGYVTNVITSLGYTPYNNTNPSGYITSSALSGYATQSWVTSQGYLTGVSWGAVTGKPSFALVATSGNYSDLSGLPTIPSLSGYATQSWVSGQGYLKSFTETDPTIYSWAKASSKPSYSWSEISSKPSFSTVATSGNYSDLSGLPTIPSLSGYAQLNYGNSGYFKNNSFIQSQATSVGGYTFLGYDYTGTVLLNALGSNSTNDGILKLSNHSNVPTIYLESGSGTVAASSYNVNGGDILPATAGVGSVGSPTNPFGSVNANTIVKNGGTPYQYLMADGSVTTLPNTVVAHNVRYGLTGYGDVCSYTVPSDYWAAQYQIGGDIVVSSISSATMKFQVSFMDMTGSSRTIILMGSITSTGYFFIPTTAITCLGGSTITVSVINTTGGSSNISTSASIMYITDFANPT